MQKTPLTFAHFAATAENRSALIAAREVAETIIADQPLAGNPLLLHGPTGTGKTHLVAALAELVVQARPDLMVTRLASSEFTATRFGCRETVDASVPTVDQPALLPQARELDLLIVEDLQHLHASVVGPFTELVDGFLVRGQPLICTADVGLQRLRDLHPRFTHRLISRLAGGVVVGMQVLSRSSREAFLRERCRHLRISDETLRWLARHLTGGMRQLLGIAHRLNLLQQAGESLDQETIAEQLQQPESVEAAVTVEAITDQVSGYFRVEVEQLRSQHRWQQVVVPRQISMYLARRCTGLSLEQIGAYFGGRDHTTVLHACRKVENALDKDVALSRAVRQLHAQLA